MRSLFLILLFIIVGAIFSILLIKASPSNVDFSLDNTGWNGFSWLRELGSQQIYDLKIIMNSPEKSILIIPSPSREPSKNEVETIKAFLRRGGTLIIANDYGYGNHWLKEIDGCEAFGSSPVLDTVLFDSDIALPKASSFNMTITLNMAVFLDTTCLNNKEITVLLQTSTFSFVDENINKQKDENEPSGPFVIGLMYKYGEGKIILLGDPSIMINYMIEKEDNREFVELLLGDKNVYVYGSILDETTLIKAKSMLNKVYVMLSAPEIKYTLGLSVALVLSTLITRLVAIYGKKEKTFSLPDFMDISKEEVLSLREELKEDKTHE